MADERLYPKRPFLAVSAAILRDGKVLVVRRARKPALGVYTLPGGVVEAGETLEQAVVREVKEETALDIAPVTLAGHREVVIRDGEGRVERHKPIRVLRDNTVIFQGELESLRRFKENVDEVRNGMECGIGVKQYNDVKPGDQIECFERIEVARTL